MKYLLIFLIMIFFVGCGSQIKILELEPSTKLSSPSVSLEIPNSFPNIPWIMSGTKYFNDDNKIYFNRHLPNMMSEDVRITVGTPENLKQSTEKFLIKNFDYDKWAKEVLSRPDIVANKKERGVNYSKKYIDYIGGLRCGTGVESSNIAMGVGNKDYYTVCGYYDNAGVKKRIDIFYSYTYTHSNTKYDTDKSSSIYSAQTMQAQFKQDIKSIFDSLVIHDMDKEKMSKEGLLYDKKYDVDTEEKIPNNIGM